MRLSEFVTEAALPRWLSQMGSKITDKASVAKDKIATSALGTKIAAKAGSLAAKGKLETQAEFSKVFKAFETWLGRTGFTYDKTLTGEVFKKNMAKTPNLDQAIKDAGITDLKKPLSKQQIQAILLRVVQLKYQAAEPEPEKPSEPDSAVERENLQDRLGKVLDALVTLSGTTEGRNALDPKESKKIEQIIKAEVSKSYQKAIDTGIYIIQLGKRYNVEHLISLWYNAIETGKDWDTLKETQNKVKLSET